MLVSLYFKELENIYIDETVALAEKYGVSVDVEFGADIPEPGVEMIVYGEFDNLVTIDRNRNVYFDYHI